MRIDSRLRALLESYDLTPYAFALAAGIKPRKVEELLAGREPTTRELHTAARFLRVSPEYLQGEDGLVGVASRPGFKALIALLDNYSPRQQDAVLAVLVETVRRGMRIHEDEKNLCL